MHSSTISNDAYSDSSPDCHVDKALLDVVIAQMELGVGWCIHVCIEAVMVCLCFTLDVLEDWKVAVRYLGCACDEAELGVVLIEAQGTERCYSNEFIGLVLEELFDLIDGGLGAVISSSSHLVTNGNRVDAAVFAIVRYSNRHRKVRASQLNADVYFVLFGGFLLLGQHLLEELEERVGAESKHESQTNERSRII